MTEKYIFVLCSSRIKSIVAYKIFKDWIYKTYFRGAPPEDCSHFDDVLKISFNGTTIRFIDGSYRWISEIFKLKEYRNGPSMDVVLLDELFKIGRYL